MYSPGSPALMLEQIKDHFKGEITLEAFGYVLLGFCTTLEDLFTRRAQTGFLPEEEETVGVI